MQLESIGGSERLPTPSSRRAWMILRLGDGETNSAVVLGDRVRRPHCIEVAQPSSTSHREAFGPDLFGFEHDPAARSESRFDQIFRDSSLAADRHGLAQISPAGPEPAMPSLGAHRSNRHLVVAAAQPDLGLELAAAKAHVKKQVCSAMSNAVSAKASSSPLASATCVSTAAADHRRAKLSLYAPRPSHGKMAPAPTRADAQWK